MADHLVTPVAKNYSPDLLSVESLDIEAQGIAHRADGKVVFIEGALPYEIVTANVYRKKHRLKKRWLCRFIVNHPNA